MASYRKTMRAFLLIALLLLGCRISRGANKHDPQFGWADRDVTHSRTLTPRSLSRDGMEPLELDFAGERAEIR